jgi:hypothetical protein
MGTVASTVSADPVVPVLVHRQPSVLYKYRLPFLHCGRFPHYFIAMETSQFTFNQKAQSLRVVYAYSVLGFSESTVSLFSEGSWECEFCIALVVLLKLQDAIRRKLTGQLERRVLLYHENAGPYTVQATQERIRLTSWNWPLVTSIFWSIKKPPWW